MMALIASAETQSAAQSAWRVWGSFALADPQFLALLPLGLLLLFYGRSRRGRAPGRVSLAVTPSARSLRQRLLWLPTALQLLALCGIVIALARPLRANVQSDVTSEGVDIALVVDRSSSMRFDDLEAGRNRLDVVKDVVGEFAERRMNDREGAADSVSLIAFARYPNLLCPFTLDSGALLGFLDELSIVERREEDGTAIGVALAKAVSILRESEAKSRIAILLTDGENNVQDILPLSAAELAAEEGVRVYTIYAARYVYVHDPFRGYQPREGSADTSELEAIAELTQGRFYRATDSDSLAEIYGEIEALERTPRTERRYEETFDLYALFLLPALACYLSSWLSSATWARRLP